MAEVSRDVLCVVPARGGSKGIPGKNMRMVGDRPLIAYTLDALLALAEERSLRIVVSSDDERILSYSRLAGVETLRRTVELAEDHVPVAAVANAVADELGWDGPVGIFQPTSPLRTPTTIRHALDLFFESDVDSLATVVQENHLFWYDEAADLTHARPLFGERVNRQQARNGLFRETGSIQIVRRDVLRAGTTVGARHRLILESNTNTIDVDTFADLEAVRLVLDRSLVYFRLSANRGVGSGHMYRCLQLAELLSHHDVRFVLENSDDFARDAIRASGFEAQTAADFWSALESNGKTSRTVTVNDVLDTTSDEILKLRLAGHLVVNLEDLGSGAKFANLVVNSLYPYRSQDRDTHAGTVLNGHRYHVLRPEFLGLPPKEIRPEGASVLVTFGGTDPSRLALKAVDAVRASVPESSIHVILGPGYNGSPDEFPRSVQVTTHVRNMAEVMMTADVVLTSAGRTVYEAAATGTPVVVMAQNAREATHGHVSLQDGVVYLGLGAFVSVSQLGDTVSSLLVDKGLREELSRRLRANSDGLGAERITYHIEGLLKGLSE